MLCADGSDLAVRAASVGLALLRPTNTVLIVTVIDGADPALMFDGSGHAGPSMTPEAFDALRGRALDAAQTIVRQTVEAIQVDNVETRVAEGPPGQTLCDVAAEVSASALIMGTRGRGGFKRAVMGSVSDYVIRNAACPVLVVNQAGAPTRK